jgi:glycine/D-amino acid oxidase-like deaminating enzyme
MPGRPGYWAACAVMAGFSQGGGVGKTVAEWMIEGEPSSDVFAMDVADKIVNEPRDSNDNPNERMEIKSVSIVEE